MLIFIWFKVSFISSLMSLLTHSLFSNMCYLDSMSLCIFQGGFLWLISCFIVLWSEKMLYMISIFLNLLRLVMCPNMWPILGNVPCALEKSVYSTPLGWNALKISVKSMCFMFHYGCCFLVDFLSGRSIHWCQWGIKVPYYVLLSVSLFMSIKICFMYLCALMLGA